MSTLLTVPELADGGYWYVVPIVPDAERGEGSQTPGDIPSGWCAWYGNSGVVVRYPEVIAGLPVASDVQVSTVLAEAGEIGKPFGRVEGS